MVYSLKRKMKILKHVRLGVSSVEEVSKIRKIPKKTIYRWLEKFEKHGLESLENNKPGQKSAILEEGEVQRVLDLWNSRARGVHKMYLALDGDLSERQIQKVYRKHNLKMNRRKRPSQIKFLKYEWPKPNMLWHTDWTVCPFTKTQLIAFLDDYSRFIVHAEYFSNATTENTLLAFINAINHYGKPQAILTDQGTQFKPAKSKQGTFTQFCENNKIKHILARIHHPQTNGKIERWFGTYKTEFKQNQDTLKTFIKYYNEERLHQGIHYKTPLERYKSNINAV